jgi:hypothetical protein
LHSVFLKRKEALGRLKFRWEKNIKLYAKETECECMYWIYVAKDYVNLQDFVKSTNRRAERTSWNFLTSLANHET